MKTWDRREMERVKVFWSGKIISIQPRIRPGWVCLPHWKSIVSGGTADLIPAPTQPDAPRVFGDAGWLWR